MPPNNRDELPEVERKEDDSNNPFNIEDTKICEDDYDIFTFENIVYFKENPTLLDIKCNGINYVGIITDYDKRLDLLSIPKTITVNAGTDGIHKLIVSKCCFKTVNENVDHNRTGGKQKTKRKQYKKSKSKKSKKNKKKTTRKNKCGKRFPKN